MTDIKKGMLLTGKAARYAHTIVSEFVTGVRDIARIDADTAMVMNFLACESRALLRGLVMGEALLPVEADAIAEDLAVQLNTEMQALIKRSQPFTENASSERNTIN